MHLINPAAEFGRREFIAGAADAAMRHSAPPKRGPVAQMGPPLAAELPADLPFTGDDEENEIGIGAAALAFGIPLLALGHHGRELDA